MSESIRVIIADDHTIVRSGIRLLLEAEPGIEVVGEALNGSQALELVEKLLPEVVLMDISMPGMDGLEATRQIKSRFTQVQVLVLTMHRSDEYFFEMLKAGASGYVLKGAETAELINAIRIVSRGEVFIYPSMAQKLVKGYLDNTNWNDEVAPGLTRREKEILTLLGEGYSATEIARKLVISPSTVHTHQGNLMTKLGLDSRYGLIQYARQHGLTHI
jgi:two-component system response regulator NreC